MKTIDKKSLLVGICASLLILTLTSGKSTDEPGQLQLSSNMDQLLVFNPKTKTLYEYKLKVKGYDNAPNRTYKVSEDGSALTKIE